MGLNNHPHATGSTLALMLAIAAIALAFVIPVGVDNQKIECTSGNTNCGTPCNDLNGAVICKTTGPSNACGIPLYPTIACQENGIYPASDANGNSTACINCVKPIVTALTGLTPGDALVIQFIFRGTPQTITISDSASDTFILRVNGGSMKVWTSSVLSSTLPTTYSITWVSGTVTAAVSTWMSITGLNAFVGGFSSVTIGNGATSKTISITTTQSFSTVISGAGVFSALGTCPFPFSSTNVTIEVQVQNPCPSSGAASSIGGIMGQIIVAKAQAQLSDYSWSAAASTAIGAGLVWGALIVGNNEKVMHSLYQSDVQRSSTVSTSFTLNWASFGSSPIANSELFQSDGYVTMGAGSVVQILTFTFSGSGTACNSMQIGVVAIAGHTVPWSYSCATASGTTPFSVILTVTASGADAATTVVSNDIRVYVFQ